MASVASQHRHSTTIHTALEGHRNTLSTRSTLSTISTRSIASTRSTRSTRQYRSITDAPPGLKQNERSACVTRSVAPFRPIARMRNGSGRRQPTHRQIVLPATSWSTWCLDVILCDRRVAPLRSIARMRNGSGRRQPTHRQIVFPATSWSTWCLDVILCDRRVAPLRSIARMRNGSGRRQPTHRQNVFPRGVADKTLGTRPPLFYRLAPVRRTVTICVCALGACSRCVEMSHTCSGDAASSPTWGELIGSSLRIGGIV